MKLVLQAHLASLALQDHVASLEIQAPLVGLASLVNLVQEVLPALQEALDLLERPEKLALRELVDLKAFLEQLGGPDGREIWDHQETLAIPAHQGYLEQQV